MIVIMITDADDDVGDDDDNIADDDNILISAGALVRCRSPWKF